MQLDNILNGFPCYKAVQEATVLERLLPDYLKNAELAVSEGLANQGRQVAKMVGQTDLSSRSVVFHEKCEIGFYLGLFNVDLGFKYSEEEVRNGTAYNDNYERAHDMAERLELLLLQHVAKSISGKELPSFAIIPARPITPIFDPDLKISRARMGLYLPHNSTFGVYSGFEKFVPLEFNPEEVQSAFEMFERFGSQYGTPDFKERVLAMVQDFVCGTNLKFRMVEAHLESAKKLQAQPSFVYY